VIATNSIVGSDGKKMLARSAGEVPEVAWRLEPSGMRVSRCYQSAFGLDGRRDEGAGCRMSSSLPRVAAPRGNFIPSNTDVRSATEPLGEPRQAARR